ncbi:MAG: CNNM domain-containing protein [Betaproteobacteria bacterium]|nr:CNNM domain-containing protein [Betaproteobacteria bacterium]
MEVLILFSLILLNGVFAMSEVALLTASKQRLQAQARGGDLLAAAAVRLGLEPTRFLSTIQIGITSIGLLSGIYGEAVLAAPLAKWLETFGIDPRTSSIVSTAIVVVTVTYVSIVVGEIVPKRLGQYNAEKIARLVAWPMRILAIASAPFVHLLSASTDAILKPVLRLLGINEVAGSQPLSPTELRTIVLESSNFLPKKHVSILLNLFDLESITVNDVMTPRNQIESIDIDAAPEVLRQQLATAYHRRLPVYQGQPDNIVGIIQLRKVLSVSQDDEISAEHLREIMREPYFIPSGTPLFTQLQQFQEHQDRLCFVVDEYGELMGLLTLEDIVEELIGEFATHSPLQPAHFHRQDDGSYVVEGGSLLRELNRKLGYRFPLDGPKTLNGLILEHFRDIPEPGVSVRIAGHRMDIVQTQDRVVKAVRLAPAADAALEPAAGS